MLLIERLFPEWKTYEIYESSPIPRGASLKLRENCPGYTASFYFPKEQLGSTVQGFRNENMEKTTFESGIFDLIVTQDVLEHVNHPDLVFRADSD